MIDRLIKNFTTTYQEFIDAVTAENEHNLGTIEELSEKSFQDGKKIEALQARIAELEAGEPEPEPFEPLEIVILKQKEAGSRVVDLRFTMSGSVEWVSYAWEQDAEIYLVADGKRDSQEGLTDSKTFDFTVDDRVLWGGVQLRIDVKEKGREVYSVRKDVELSPPQIDPKPIDPDSKPNPSDYSLRVKGFRGLAAVNNAPTGTSVFVEADPSEYMNDRPIIISDFFNSTIQFDFNHIISGELVADGHDSKIWFVNNKGSHFTGASATYMPHDAFVFKGNEESTFEKFISTFSYLSGCRLESGNKHNDFLDIIMTDARQSYGNGDSDADGFSASDPTDANNTVDGFLFEYNADDGGDGWLSTGTIFKNGISRFNGIRRKDGKAVGNGNGFKLGGRQQDGTASCINCEASDNLANGFDTNTGTGVHVVERCFGYRNGGELYRIYNNGKVINPQ